MEDIFNLLRNLKFKLTKIFKTFGKIIYLAFVFIIFILLIFFFSKIFSTKSLQISFLDVGQGDAILFNLPGRKQILLDAGRDENIIHKIDNNLSIFDRQIDFAIFSHPDGDHVNGFISLFDKYNFKNILKNEDSDHESSSFLELEKKIELNQKEKDSQLALGYCGDKLIYDQYPPTPYSLIFYILNPVKGETKFKDNNDNSLVLLLTFGKYSFLFTGDISKEMERKVFFNISRCFSKEDKILIEENLKNLTVLKVSHHGSDTASSLEFLKYLKPEYSIISAGKNNSYGHPAKSTLETLEKYSEHIFSTIDKGDIEINTDGNNFTINFEK
jgi:competence protein ComEC